MTTAAAAVTGDARVRLCPARARSSAAARPASLYDHGLATYEEGDRFEHGAAAGFIHV